MFITKKLSEEFENEELEELETEGSCVITGLESLSSGSVFTIGGSTSVSAGSVRISDSTAVDVPWVTKDEHADFVYDITDKYERLEAIVYELRNQVRELKSRCDYLESNIDRLTYEKQ